MLFLWNINKNYTELFIMIVNHFLLIIYVRSMVYLSDRQVNIVGEICLQFILLFEIILYDGMILIFEIY